MPHCQICLTPVPDHTPNCPVKTGAPVMGMSPQAAIQRALQHDQTQLQQCGGLIGAGSMAMMGSHAHDPVAIELRIEWLEKEVHRLRARIAKLERSPE